MSNGRFNESLNDALNIMPEKFYTDTLRPDLQNVLANITFDPVLVKTVEETLNKADANSIKKEYELLKEDLTPLATAILRDSYVRSDDFIRADESEKQIVRKLAKDIQSILTIITCTKSSEKEEKKFSKQRVGYDETRKENLVDNSHKDNIQRRRIPNI